MTAPAYDDRLDRETRLGSGEAFRILLRALPYIRPVRRLFALKFLTMFGSLVPLFLAPWPIKIVVDHVLQAKPITPDDAIYPPIVKELVLLMAGWAPAEILSATLLFLVGLVIVFGLQGYVGGPGSIFASNAFLADGQDQATKAENEASAGWSLSGGLWGYLDLRLSMRIAQSMTHVFRSQLMRRLVRLPMTKLDDQRIGDAIYRLMIDTPSLSSMAFDLTMSPLTQALLFTINLTVIRTTYGDVAPELFWGSLLVLPLFFALAWPFARMVREASQDARAAGSKTTDTIEEGMSNIVAVQGLGANERENERFDEDSEESFRQYRKLVRARLGMAAVTVVAGAGLVLYGAIVASNLVIEGKLSAGDFTAILGVHGLLGGTLASAATLWFNLQDNVAGARRVFFFVDMAEEGAGGMRALPPIREGIRIEDVRFRYPDGRVALDGVSLDARLGEVVALVGPTGAGKTSLAQLVPAFLRPESGRVSIDGVDLAEVTLESLRDQVAYVFQENPLFAGTIAENIADGRPAASRAEIEAAAARAGAARFIAELPEGFDTVIGRAGGRLSVGQKQRICIARGLLRDAPILILDEPTSALDPETEAALVETLREEGRNRLVIVIAHRLSTIRHADQVVFLEDGRIVEAGSHAELMARPDGAYRRYVSLQAGEPG